MQCVLERTRAGQRCDEESSSSWQAGPFGETTTPDVRFSWGRGKVWQPLGKFVNWVEFSTIVTLTLCTTLPLTKDDCVV